MSSALRLSLYAPHHDSCSKIFLQEGINHKDRYGCQENLRRLAGPVGNHADLTDIPQLFQRHQIRGNHLRLQIGLQGIFSGEFR